jgi:hypothetical protein
MSSYTPQSKSELLEIHARLFLDAPGFKFQVQHKYPERWRTLESTVEELHRGIDHVYRKTRHEDARSRMHEAVHATYNEFKSGRVHEGRMLCHRIEDLISDTRP